MSFTYAELKQALQDYTQYTETSFVNNLPVFIRQAEDRILKSVRLNIFKKNATSATTAADPYLTLPTDYLAPISLSITVAGDEQFLFQKEADFVQLYAAESTSGAPIYYGHFDVDALVLGPTPDDAYVTSLAYFYRPASITAGADSGTTWISTNAEQALLYGSLVECYVYMKGEPDMMKLYTDRFIESLSRLKNFGEGQETSDEYRSGTVRRERT